MDGGSRPPGLHPQGSALGGAAHLVPSSPAARPQGSAAGARSRPPPGTLSVLSACRTRHQLSYRPGLGPAGRVAVAILFSLSGIGLVSARA
ncbi:hypothetical protein NDU88_002640 [Pleurodeles waltl]|uniref:Uncharacterized protein n=1 Tax=Pleurodeles waltl TaxID=8319 RepID=A0AAV7T468_PLEWA|nr:hypothetical protein NDU88_002640 [Pleurodeles waltl]